MDLSTYIDNGYIIVTDFLTPDEHFELNRECRKLSEYASNLVKDTDDWTMNGPNNPCKLNNAMANSEVFRRLGRNPKLVSVAKQILGVDEVETFVSKFFPMVPREGFSVGWHQDNHYIRGDATRMVSCDVFVNGASKEDGCLRVIPRETNRTLYHNEPSHGGKFQWIDLNEGPNIVDLEHEGPFAVFFDVNLVHGCYQNKSDHHRYSVAWEYLEEGYRPSSFQKNIKHSYL